MGDNVLEIRELSKDYGDFVLDKVSFSLPRGVIMGLIGENGAGKSTTINCILNETQKTGGKILIFGKDHISDEIEIKDKLGVVFDENHFPDIFTAEEIGKFMSGIYSGWDWPLYRQHLEKFELPKDKKIKDFSKGMKVKLAFAVALSHKAELLILDEPINGLDPIGIAEVRDFIRELCDATGKTILISSHILSEISLLADDIGIIDHGVLLEEESLKELEAKNGKYFRFTVSNAALAANLLQSKLGIQNVQVDSANELTVRDLRLDTGAAVRLFVDAGLSVSDAHLYEDTLEDYFKQVTGGEGIA